MVAACVTGGIGADAQRELWKTRKAIGLRADAGFVRRAEDSSMEAGDARRSYAVTWRDGEGPVRAGRLELGESALRLEGGDARGRLYATSVRYRDVATVRISRECADRLTERSTLVVGRPDGRPIRIASVQGLGMLTEVLDRLAPLVAVA